MRKYTKHHIIPKSRKRARKGNKVVYLPETFHNAFHIVFGNMTNPEIIEFMFWLLKKMETADKIRQNEIKRCIMDIKNGRTFND